MSDSFDLGDIFDDAFGKGSVGPETPRGPSGYGTQFGQQEKGVAWEAKEFDGDLYVPIKQVGELLRANGVLPKMSAHIDLHVKNQQDKKTLDI